MARFIQIMRWFCTTLCAYTCLVVLCTSALVVCVCTFGWRKHDYFYLVSRAFGHIYLWLVGVELVYQGSLPCKKRRARILAFNHTSQLDLFIMAALIPPGGVPIMKKEMLYIPVLGQLLWLFGGVLFDRGQQTAAHASLEKGAARIQAQRLTVGISPEGTRSPDGELSIFKKGTFHLAKSAQADVQCVLLSNPHDLQPLGQWSVSPGVIRVTLLSSMSFPKQNDRADSWTESFRMIFADAIEAQRSEHGE